LTLGIRNVARGTAVLAITVVGWWILLSGASSAARGKQSPDPAEAKKVAISVSDFELSSAGPTRGNRRAASSSGQRKNGEPVYADSDPAPVQARRIIDSFANTLVDLLQKEGYTATRVSGTPPANGVLLRGVFAEADEKNRIRRAILGAGSPNPKFILYVAAFNLGHQDQPLYEPAAEQSADPRYGPVITLNAYVPMVKFEVDKNPVEQDVEKICREIVGQLTTLLVSNPNALPK
jgi:hypothetical protein